MATTKKVVILGGGYYGVNIAKELDKNPALSVVLVDKREQLLHKIGMVRGSVSGGMWAERAVIPRDKLFKNFKRNKVVQKNVVAVDENAVTYEDGSKESFDVLVLATGAKNNSPAEAPLELKSRSEILSFYATTSKEIAKAKNIVIAGGGAAGIEYAGEIKNLYGESKNVTIIHNGPALFHTHLPVLPDKFRTKVNAALSELGVQVRLNDTVTEPAFSVENFPTGFAPAPAGNTVRTSSGATIPADLVIFSVGTTHANTTLYPSSWLDAKSNNQIAVDPHFRVEAVKKGNVFAFGDCNNIKEAKLAGLAAQEAPLLAANIKAYVEGKAKLPKEYHGNKMAFLLLPMGPRRGVSMLPFGVSGNYTTSLIKGRGLFTNAFYGALNRKLEIKPPANWEPAERARLTALASKA